MTVRASLAQNHAADHGCSSHAGTHFFGIAPSFFLPMSEGVALDSSSQSAADISFCCQHCNASLVVDRTASGLTLNCQRCGRPTRIPSPTGPPLNAKPTARSQISSAVLKENAAQQTEVIGHINQVSIQLHRWQHR